jgi:hypothetical protein
MAAAGVRTAPALSDWLKAHLTAAQAASCLAVFQANSITTVGDVQLLQASDFEELKLDPALVTSIQTALKQADAKNEAEAELWTEDEAMLLKAEAEVVTKNKPGRIHFVVESVRPDVCPFLQ